mgnify:CR=1 FL=1
MDQMMKTKGANVVEIALGKLAKILLEKSMGENSPSRSQRERMDKEDDLGSYKPIPWREYVGTK